MKQLLVLVFLVSTQIFASNESANVECSAELSKTGTFSMNYVRRNLAKEIKVRKTILNKNSKTVQMKEVINFDIDYSVGIELKETLNLSTGKVEVKLNGKLFRHRVGNGKVVIGQDGTFLNFDANSFQNYINLRIENKLEIADQFNYKGVVKDAFIECTTL